ncbi:MAG TPA: hypothetical protein VM120_03200 [Bryobacteraceae bacterium]|nr:hypothetical protein [Bryobacteraceae bacterium]
MATRLIIPVWLALSPARLIAIIENSSSSIYDVLSFGLTRRFNERFLMDFHYTAASSATYSAFYADANSGIPSEWDNWRSAERAPSDFFQRHRLAANGSCGCHSVFSSQRPPLWRAVFQ